MTFTYLTGSNGFGWGSTDAESPDRPDDPGGEVLVAHAGLAGPGEHLDVPGLRVADVHHDGSRGCLHVTPGGCLQVTMGRCRGRGAGDCGRRAHGRAEGRDGKPRGARRRGALKQRTPGHTLSRLMLCIVTGHDDPFGDWSACSRHWRRPRRERGGRRSDGDPVATT